MLVAGDGILQLLLALVDIAAFIFPIHFIAYDVLEVFVRHDVVLSHDIGGISDNFFRDSYLAGNLDGEGTTWVAYLQEIERLHVGAVVEHGAVDHRGVALGKALQVLVVRGDDAVGGQSYKLVEDGFGQCAADLRFGAAAKFVNQYQRARAAVAHHLLHVEQVAGIGAEVVFDTLLVADVDEEVVEDARCAVGMYGDGEAALQHILQQTHSFQTDRLAASVGSRDEKDALAIFQLDVEGYDFAAVLAERLIEQGVLGNSPIQCGILDEFGHAGLHLLRPDGCGAQKINLREKLQRTQNLVHVRPDDGGQFLENADNLALLGGFEFADFIVGFDHRGRLNENRLARGRFIVDDTFDFALQRGSYGNY